jgi:FAD/FMN-containing dehydrogenase
MTKPPSAETLAAFAAIVGDKGVLTGDTDKAPYLTEWRGLWHGKTPMVLRPSTTQQVSEILKIANTARCAIVPQSGNTGLVGGQTPKSDGTEIALSLDRMTRIITVDAANDTITVEAGATLKSVQDGAENAGRMFPLSLASEGSARIGGNLSTNAGGLNVLAYGNARELCLGLEVVLADGRVLNTLRGLRKDNTGYDLRNIFIGAEGTLGIITAATLKLFPQMKRHDTAFVAVPSPDAALQLLASAKQASGNTLVAFELIAELCVTFSVRHMGQRNPLDTSSPWYVLMELADAPEGLFEQLLEQALEKGLATDGALAQSKAQRQAFWGLREAISESQKPEGGSIKHDVSVPVSKIPQFIAEATAAVEQFLPGCRFATFGHMGDGNLHFNVSQPVGQDKQAYLAKWHAMNDIVHEIAVKLGGSFSAEHGIGTLKIDDMRRYKSAVELDVMRGLKTLFDPNGILSPGRVLPDI